MSGLPVATAKKVVKALRQAGFFEHHSTGSHLIMRHTSDIAKRVTIPMHSRDLKPKTMRAIIKQSGLSAEAFSALL